MRHGAEAMATLELGLDPDGSVPSASAAFPTIHSVISPSAVLRTIASAYRVPAPAKCTLVRPGLNDTYLLTSPAGRYIARVYGARHRSRPEVAYELELLRHLRSKGVSVSSPVPAADGALSVTLRAPEGPRQAAVFTYAEGRPISWRDAQHCLAAGRLAARLHDGADDFVTSHARPALDLVHLIDEPLDAVRPFLAGRVDELAYLSDLATRLRGRAAVAIQEGLDWGPCHGDLGAKNIHVCEGLTAFDFDLSGPGWRVYDFAPVYRATRAPAMRRGWDAFLRGYQERRPLAQSDLAAVPLFRVLRHFAMLGSFASNAQSWGTSSLDDRSLDRWLAFFAAWEKEAGEGSRHQAALRPRAIVRRADDLGPRLADAGRLTVVSSLLDPAGLAAEIERSYPIGGSVRCQLLHRGLNDTYLLTTPRGDEQYVARIYHPGPHQATKVHYELGLLAHLARRGVPIAPAVPAHDGRALVELAAPEGPRFVALFARASGAPLSWERADHARTLGALAAQVHAASDDFCAEYSHRAIDLENLVDRPLAALAPYLEHRQNAHLRTVAADLRARVEAADAEGLDWGPCHGDLRPERVLLAGDGKATVGGFDRCGPGWRAYDFAIVRWGSQGRDDHPFWRGFLAGYANLRPLRAADSDAVSVLYAVHRLWALGLRAENVRRWGTRQVSEDVVDEEVAFLDAWHEEERR
jgi:Ser/Thr protein kinase RdoA (MazF antagonist)